MSKPGDSVQDSYLVYPGFTPQSWGVCHLRIIPKPPGALLVASEIRHNPGPSVTNAIEGIWSAILKKYPIETLGESPLLVEHYHNQAVYGETGQGERWVLVNVQKGKTSWHHTSLEEIVALTGCSPGDLDIPLEQLVLKFRGGRG